MPDPTQDGAAKRPRGDGVPPPKGFDPSRAPRAGDDRIRALATEAVREGRIWTIAEWMETMTDEPRWNGCWVAFEAAILAAHTPRQGRLISYIGREFLPTDTPPKMQLLVHEADMWLARRLGDKGGYALARQRLEFWRTRGRRRPGEPPRRRTEPDAAERVLECYLRLAEEAGLVIGFTRPATAVINALPLHGLKAALAWIVDLYSTDGNSRSSVLVTLRAVRAVLRSMPAPKTTPSQSSTGS